MTVAVVIWVKVSELFTWRLNIPVFDKLINTLKKYNLSADIYILSADKKLYIYIIS